MMPVYPDAVFSRAIRPRFAATAQGTAEGRSASFVCGCFAAFSVSEKSGIEAAYRSNGCGYMMSAADILAELVSGREVSELHGLEERKLSFEVERQLGGIGSGRKHCIETAIEALRASFAELRRLRVEEFSGEQALICTCFGVSEETIERSIGLGGLTTVADVSAATRAGLGCGSCRMLIQEMLDGQ